MDSYSKPYVQPYPTRGQRNAHFLATVTAPVGSFERRRQVQAWYRSVGSKGWMVESATNPMFVRLVLETQMQEQTEA